MERNDLERTSNRGNIWVLYCNPPGKTYTFHWLTVCSLISDLRHLYLGLVIILCLNLRFYFHFLSSFSFLLISIRMAHYLISAVRQLSAALNAFDSDRQFSLHSRVAKHSPRSDTGDITACVGAFISCLYHHYGRLFHVLFLRHLHFGLEFRRRRLTRICTSAQSIYRTLRQTS